MNKVNILSLSYLCLEGLMFDSRVVCIVVVGYIAFFIITYVIVFLLGFSYFCFFQSLWFAITMFVLLRFATFNTYCLFPTYICRCVFQSLRIASKLFRVCGLLFSPFVKLYLIVNQNRISASQWFKQNIASVYTIFNTTAM